MHTSKKEIQYGELIIASQAILHGIFPILINYSVQKIPPIFFIGITTLIASAGLFIILIIQGKYQEIFNKKAFPLIMLVTLFNVVLGNLFIFLGTHETSGINTALLLQAEIPFSFLVLGILFQEKIPHSRMIAGIMVFMGTLLVLYEGELSFKRGDLLIVLGTLFYPFGNHFAKKALKQVSPATILFMRSLLGGLTLVWVSIAFEKTLSESLVSLKDQIGLVLIQVVVFLILAKIMWYEGIKRIDVTQAISISMTYPAFSLVFAMLFLKEIPNVYQIGGLALIILSIIFMMNKGKKPQILDES